MARVTSRGGVHCAPPLERALGGRLRRGQHQAGSLIEKGSEEAGFLPLWIGRWRKSLPEGGVHFAPPRIGPLVKDYGEDGVKLEA